MAKINAFLCVKDSSLHPHELWSLAPPLSIGINSVRIVAPLQKRQSLLLVSCSRLVLSIGVFVVVIIIIIVVVVVTAAEQILRLVGGACTVLVRTVAFQHLLGLVLPQFLVGLDL